MRSQKPKTPKTYFIAPNLDYPHGGPLRLGAILTSPSDPGSCINRDGTIPFPSNMPVSRTLKTDWRSERKRRAGGTVGIWAEFLKFLGMEVEANIGYERETSDVYKFDVLETESVEPTKDYIEESVLDPVVSSHIVETGYRKSIYMITGVKVARGATVALQKRWEVGGHVRVGADAMFTGVPLTTGPQIGVAGGRGDHVSFKGGSDFVFAYRLREIYYERGLRMRDRQYTKGALYDVNIERPPSSPGDPKLGKTDSAEPFLKVGSCADEPETIRSLGLQTIDVLDDEDGELCACILPRRTS